MMTFNPDGTVVRRTIVNNEVSEQVVSAATLSQDAVDAYISWLVARHEDLTRQVQQFVDQHNIIVEAIRNLKLNEQIDAEVNNIVKARAEKLDTEKAEA